MRPVAPGEGPLLVAEQLRLDQRVGKRGAAHLDERLLRPQRVVVDGVGDQLLAGAGLAADEHRGVGLRDLRHLLVHLPRGTAGADDVREVVAFAQLLPQVRVLVEQSPPLLLDQPLHVERLRDHRADDAEELHAAVVVALRLEAEVDGERADGGAVHRDRHADEAELLLADGRDGAGRRLRNAGSRLTRGTTIGSPAFDHLAGDPLADLEAHGAGAVLEALGGLDQQLAVAQQRHHAAHHAVVADERGEHTLHRSLQIERARQGLAHLQQGRQAPRIARGGSGIGSGLGGRHSRSPTFWAVRRCFRHTRVARRPGRTRQPACTSRGLRPGSVAAPRLHTFLSQLKMRVTFL